MRINWLVQLSKFGIIGLLIAMIAIMLYYLCFEYFNTNLYLTYIFVNLICISISYFFNALITFNKKLNRVDLFKYFLVYLIGIIFGLTIIYIINKTTHLTNFHTALVQIIPRALFNFALSKFLIFD